MNSNDPKSSNQMNMADGLQQNANHRPWLIKETLEEGLKNRNPSQLAKYWKCDKRVIYKWAKHFGIQTNRSWPNGHIEYLKKHAMTMSYSQIAKRLKRSYYSVRCMALVLNISVFDHITSHVMLWDLAEELGVSLATLYTHIKRHGLPAQKLRSTKRGQWNTIDRKQFDEWLSDGHILRFDPKHMNETYKKMYAHIRDQWITQTELESIDPWLGHYSLHGQRKRGVPPKPLLTGKKVDGTFTTYYKKTELFNHYFIYGDTIPAYIKCDWINAIRDSWQSIYIMAYDVYKIIPRATCHRYHSLKNFPSCYYRSYYDRGELVQWLEEYGWHDKAKLIKSDPVTYQEIMEYLATKRKRYTINWESATSWQ